jgi:hypothetical protein
MWGRLDGVGLSDADLTETALSRVSSASSSLRCDMLLSRAYGDMGFNSHTLIARIDEIDELVEPFTEMTCVAVDMSRSTSRWWWLGWECHLQNDGTSTAITATPLQLARICVVPVVIYTTRRDNSFANIIYHYEHEG